MRILITGASGFIGQQLIDDLAVQHPDWSLIASDSRPLADRLLKPNVERLPLDISQPAAVLAAVESCRPKAIVPLASVVCTPPGMSAAQRHAIDVGGTASIIQAALANDVEQLIVTSAGAAYGYCPEIAERLDEDAPLRGHAKFTDAQHKCEVERLLVSARALHPQLRQLVLRPGTILGKRVSTILPRCSASARCWAFAAAAVAWCLSGIRMWSASFAKAYKTPAKVSSIWPVLVRLVWRILPQSSVNLTARCPPHC
jgi:UDP-glucose 4-epimerase